MNHNYAKKKLTSLLKNLNSYTADEFRREMARIITGATGQDVPDDCHAIKAERDALAAQVGAMKSAIDDVQKYTAKSGFDFPSPSDIRAERLVWSRLAEVIKLLPQQHIAEIRAEAGRAGFIAGVNAHSNAKTFGAKFDRDSRADEYAATVRQGGAE